MPQQSLIKKNFSFSGGLVTDSGLLQQVPNSWIDGDNMIPFLDGHIERRPKLDLELAYASSPVFTETVRISYAFNVDQWRNVGGDGLLTFAVVQVGTTVYFYNCVATSISPNIKSFSIDLNTYKCPTSPNVFGTSPISISQGNGKLIIVSADTDPILVAYNATADTISVTRLTLKLRDFYGILDTTPITTNPVALTALHNYNLLNQGWLTAHINTYKAAIGTYPDDTQIWTQGKDATDTFSAAQLDKMDFGTSAAPKGRHILDLFNRDRTTASGVVGLTIEVENYRPIATAFFAGRAWYAGTQSTTIGSWVMFSRITDTDIKYEQCYQEGDPTAEFTSDLISSDGGVIPIPGAGGILLLKPIQESLLVFAQNGIWQILGDASGFKADGYQLKQIASFGITSAKSVVDVENTVMFWSTAGIYTLDKDTVSGDFVPKSLSLGKIQTLFAEYQEQSHIAYVQGFYDSVDKIVYWMHHVHTDADPISNNDRFKINSFLMFNVALGAFYTFSVDDFTGIEIVGGFLSPNAGDSETAAQIILTNGDLVVVGIDNVVIQLPLLSLVPRLPKFLTIIPNGASFSVTFSDFLNVENTPNKFKDWYTYNTIGQETAILPFLITGYDIVEDGVKSRQAPHVITYLLKTETGFDASFNALNASSCLMQGRWEWTDNSAASRWSTAEQVYRHRNLYVPSSSSDTYTDGYPLVIAKSKIRGKGRALQIKYTSGAGLDMQLAGWAIHYMGNTNV